MKLESIIREATKEDAATVADIYNFYLGNGTMDLEPKTAEYFYYLIDANNEREKLFVSVYDEKVVGYGIIKKYSDREGYRVAAETSIYYIKDFTGKGFGRVMQSHLLKEAASLEYKHLVAKIWSSNSGSIEFHESLGYTIVGQQHKIGFVNGEWQDVTIMQYIVD